MTAPNYLAQQGWSYQACEQSVEFVAVLDAVLASVETIPSLSVGLADAIQAPLAPKFSYASVAKSDEYEAISGRGRAKETIFSASLDAEQAIRLVKRAQRWQDSDCSHGVMIAKEGEQLTPKIFQKIVSKLAEQIDPNKKQGIQLRAMNMSPLDQSVSISSVLAAHVAGDHVPAVPSKRELKTWDELTLRSREARLKLGVDISARRWRRFARSSECATRTSSPRVSTICLRLCWRKGWSTPFNRSRCRTSRSRGSLQKDQRPPAVVAAMAVLGRSLTARLEGWLKADPPVTHLNTGLVMWHLRLFLISSA